MNSDSAKRRAEKLACLFFKQVEERPATAGSDTRGRQLLLTQPRV